MATVEAATTTTAAAGKAHVLGSARAFVRPVHCGVCGENIWGIMKGGYQCTECFMPLHKRCKGKMALNCGVWQKDAPHKPSGDGKGNMSEISHQRLPEFAEAPAGITASGAAATFTDSQVYHTAPTPTPDKDGPPNPGRQASPAYPAPVPAPGFPQMTLPPATAAPAPTPTWPPAAGGYGPPPTSAPLGYGYPPPAGAAPYSWGAPAGGAFGPPPGGYPGYGYPSAGPAAPGYAPGYPPYGGQYGSPTHPGAYPGPPPPAAVPAGYPPPAAPHGGGYGGSQYVPRFGKAEPIERDYERGVVLGKGAFSEVVKYRERSTGKEWAVKVMKKNFRDPIALEVTSAEIGIYKSVGAHPNIVQLHDIYETDSHWYLVIQLITGGELLHRITELKTFSERDASEFAAQMFHGIRHLHRHNIVHRDLKPENLLLSDKSADAQILLTDFGLSKQLADRHELIFHPVGTPGYLSPELVHCMQRGSPYGIECDMWAAGVIIYIMLCGFPPFWGRDNNELFGKITAVQYSFPDPYWKDISADAKNLIYHLLMYDPKQRFDIEQALAHRWITEREKLKTQFLEQTHQQLAQFNARRQFGAAIKKVMILNRLGMTASQTMAAGLDPDAPIASSSTNE